MKKKGMLIFTFLMLLCNTLTMYYVSQALKQEINIYVVQVGRYKEKANAENTMKQIEELGIRVLCIKIKSMLLLLIFL